MTKSENSKRLWQTLEAPEYNVGVRAETLTCSGAQRGSKQSILPTGTAILSRK